MASDARTPAQLRNMFGENLRILVRDYASVSALSRDLGINRTQFNRYLSGESFPRPDVLSRICDFFGVDARVLLEPVSEIATGNGMISGRFLSDFMGPFVQQVPEDVFPSGFYRFSRRSFVKTSEFVRGLIFVCREDGKTFIRGYEPRMALAMQGIPADSRAREYRGFALRLEDGVAVTVTRRNGMTASFNYLSRVNSFDNNFWVGYVARTVRENPTTPRITRLVYEHIGRDLSRALETSRQSGFCGIDELMPFHQRLLQPDDPIR